MPLHTQFSAYRTALRRISCGETTGTVIGLGSLELFASGLGADAKMGSHVIVAGHMRGEIVGVGEGRATILPFGTWEGVSYGDPVSLLDDDGAIHPDESWLGRSVDAFGEPLDKDLLVDGRVPYDVKSEPPDAFDRRVMGEKLQTGIKGMDVFTPICRGQRLAILAGSGVGKSTLMAMLARQTDADVIVIGLIGERGREVRDFISRDLGPEGLARSVVVVATSDQPPLTRRQAAWTTTAVAEYFRDQGKQVLMVMDSVTRFAMAQREIGLAAGEPPTTRGYTPTVFSELPRLLERSGPGRDDGSAGDITAVYTVLVDGDDMNEPISDTVRGILDGHVVLDRKIAETGRYPAINISKSISRALPRCHSKAEREIMNAARRAMSRHAEMEDLVRIGAYRPGTDSETDASIRFAEAADGFLSQNLGEPLSSEEAFATLYGLLVESGINITLEDLEQVDPD